MGTSTSRRLLAAVEAAGYGGDIEVEVFNADVWAADGDAVVSTMLRRCVSDVLLSDPDR